MTLTYRPACYSKNKEIQLEKYQQWNWDRLLILMSVVGLWLWGWVITLSLPFGSSAGRCSVSLGCQLLLKALLTQRYSFHLFISCLYLYFPSTDVWEYLWLKHNILFHFGKEIKLFFLSPLAKDTIPSGRREVYLTPSTMLCQNIGSLLGV